MKGLTYLLIGLVFGMVIGWALGFLRLPYIEQNGSFLLGFTAALAIVAFGFVLSAARNGSLPPGAQPAVRGARALPRLIPVGVLALAGLVGGVAFFRRHATLERAIQDRDRKLLEMAALVESVKNNNLQPLLDGLLRDIGEELKRTPRRTLSDTTIARITALSFAFKPYPYIEADSISEQAYSPERGQLLQTLLLLEVDTGSFNRIKRDAHFVGADLHGADLKARDLGGINLAEANLKDADLSDADLQGATLTKAGLWGANLNRANLGKADLKRADLRWAKLNEAILRVANLNGANLSNAQLRKADLYDAMFQWTQSVGALMNEANLTSVDFLGSNLANVNLSGANLTAANLSKANLNEADLVGATLTNTFVDLNWPQKLKEWQPMGGQKLRESYSVVNDTFNKWNDPLYRLKKL